MIHRLSLEAVWHAPYTVLLMPLRGHGGFEMHSCGLTRLAKNRLYMKAKVTIYSQIIVSLDSTYIVTYKVLMS